MEYLYFILFFVLGCILGGFYSALGNRLGSEDYHFLPYRCNVCGEKISFLESIPLLSYL